MGIYIPFPSGRCHSFTDEKRRILLAGEAAHLFAPFGARGSNSGVPDAIISVRGIEKALQSNSEAERKEAVDAAATERRIAAKWNRDGSTTALHHLQGDAPEMNLKRELAASLVSIVPRLGRWLDEGPVGPKFGPPELTTKLTEIRLQGYPSRPDKTENMKGVD